MSVYKTYHTIGQRSVAGTMPASGPYRLLAAAVIAQCAEDADIIAENGDSVALRQKYGKYCSTGYIAQFINSDWLDNLLSWQTDITVMSVCENIVHRLQRGGAHANL